MAPHLTIWSPSQFPIDEGVCGWPSWIVEGPPQDCSGKGWTQETDLGVQAAGVWVSRPPGNSKVGGCFLFSYHIIFDVVCRVQQYQEEVSMEAQLVVFILFIALAKVIFRAITILMVLGCWFLVPRLYRYEFLCSSLCCLHLIKVKFPDLNPVTFPSVVCTMGLWCQPLSMCLGGKRLTSGHYFDSFSHHCFCLHPDVPGVMKQKAYITMDIYYHLSFLWVMNLGAA